MNNTTTSSGVTKKKRIFSEPHIFFILFLFIAIMAILSRVIPSGVYDRVPMEVEGGVRMVIDPDSYHTVARTPVGLLDIFIAVPKGFAEAAVVIAITFCVGGAFGVLKKTGVISVAVAALSRKMSKRGIFIIPVLMTVFAIIAAFIGTQELSLIYVPIILPLVIALGFDSVTAAAIALCATTAGFTGAITNPFTVGIAQKIAGLPLYSGSVYRTWVLVILTCSSILYVLFYAYRVKKNPSASVVGDLESSLDNPKDSDFSDLKFSNRQILVGIASSFLFCLMIWGVLSWGWEMLHMGGMMLLIGFVAGILGGLNPNELCRAFEDGFSEVLLAAMIMGVARGVAVVMTQGQIIDSIIYGMAQVIKNIPPAINAIGMFFVQTFFNFFVASGSGQAVITMPIMAPLADVVGVSRQVSVLAFQMGDGLSNIMFPTSGYFMAVLALAKIPWTRWLRFMLPLFVIQATLSCVLLVFAQMIGWS